LSWSVGKWVIVFSMRKVFVTLEYTMKGLSKSGSVLASKVNLTEFVMFWTIKNAMMVAWVFYLRKNYIPPV